MAPRESPFPLTTDFAAQLRQEEQIADLARHVQPGPHWPGELDHIAHRGIVALSSLAMFNLIAGLVATLQAGLGQSAGWHVPVMLLITAMSILHVRAPSWLIQAVPTPGPSDARLAPAPAEDAARSEGLAHRYDEDTLRSVITSLQTSAARLAGRRRLTLPMWAALAAPLLLTACINPGVTGDSGRYVLIMLLGSAAALSGAWGLHLDILRGDQLSGAERADAILSRQLWDDPTPRNLN